MYEMREYREPRYGTNMHRSPTYGPSGTPGAKVAVRSTPYEARLIILREPLVIHYFAFLRHFQQSF